MTQRSHEMAALSAKYASLPEDKRSLFRARLNERRISRSLLPIVALEPRPERFPLSHAQERLWFSWKLAAESAAYNLPSAVRLRGKLDIEAVRRAIDGLALRHEALRTRFEEVRGVGWQRVDAEPKYEWQVLEQQGAGAEEGGLVETLRSLSLRPFDLERGHLLRATLIALGAEDHVLHFVMHHIISDAWSQGLAAEQFAAFYAAALEGGQPELPALSVQYPDYALWQREWLDDRASEGEIQHFRELLGSEHAALELPVSRRRIGARQSPGGQVTRSLAAPLSRQLRSWSQQRGATLFMTLLSAYYVLLARYSGQREIRVGVPVAGREALEVQGLIGFFVNTLVIKEQVRAEDEFSDLLARVRERVLDAQAHQELPFAKLVSALEPQRNVSQTPLFQAIFNYVNAPTRALGLPGLRATALEQAGEVARFDLALNVGDGQGALSFSLGYAKDILDASTIERMAQDYEAILAAIASDGSTRMGRISLPGGAIQRAAPASYPFLQLTEQLRERARERPDAPALSCEGQRLSRAELERWSNRIAERLLAAGVQADERVGLMVQRSPALVASLLGILAAGAAFVPLDPAYPAERLGYMLDDAGVSRVVVDRATLGEHAQLLANRTPIPAELEPEASAARAPDGPSAARQVPVHPDQLAYVIYTSGSTGQPKGVAISHRALSIHLNDFIAVHRISEQDKTLQSSTINFDVALHELLPALLQGGSVEMRGPEPWDLQTMTRHLVEERVSFARMPTAYWQQWLAHPPAAEALPHLRQITVGGEGLPGDALRRWQEGPLGHIPLANLYGPTETTVACTHRQTAPGDADELIAPIGVAYPGRTARVMDDAGNTAPRGALGELCIGGDTLARGYLNRPGQTALVFVPDPEGAPGSRVYRSGDLCREAADGSVKYVGRIDQQIKLRGFRIELGEIETLLRQVPGVREAAVELRGEGEGKRLVGYFAGDASEQELARHLQQKLPAHMVPSAFVRLERLPVMPNGKIDRKALPEPGAQSAVYVAPSSDIERKLAEVWQHVLKVERVSVDDNFFELGGDSILSLQIIARAREQGIKITPRQIFERQTVRELGRVARASGAPAAAVKAARFTGDQRLIPIQRRFFESVLEQRNHYNQSILLEALAPLDAVKLEAAVRAVVSHHEVLTSTFRRDAAAGWLQHYGAIERTEPLLWVRQVEDVAGIDRVGAEAQRSLDLERGPLLRAVLMRLPDGGERLQLVIHHLVVDGVSWRVVLEDLSAAYTLLVDGRAPQLAEPTTPFREWSEKLATLAASRELQAELPYWQGQAARAPERELPRDYPQGTNRVRDRASQRVALDARWTERLVREAPRAYATQINDLLLTALARVLVRYCAQSSVLVQLEGHGREDLFEEVDLSRTVGWFTTLFPVRLEPDPAPGEAAIARSIQAVKEQLRGVPRKGIGYGLLRYLAGGNVRQRLEGLSAARVTFNYLGQLDSSPAARALFRPAPERAGSDQDDDAPLSNWLSVSGQIYGGKLQLSFAYSRALYREQTIQGLARAYGEELRTLIEHCTSGVSGATPSDISPARPTQGACDASGTLVLMEPGAQRTPLYCLHYGGGAILAYRSLAKALRGARPVYGLQSRLFYRRDWVDTSYEDMAEHYAEVIAVSAPRQRVHLLGWSWGVLLALETASKLRALGYEAPFVGLVDYPPLMRGQEFDEGIRFDAALARSERATRLQRFQGWIERAHFASQWRLLMDHSDPDTLDELLALFSTYQVSEHELDTPAEFMMLDRAQSVLLSRRYVHKDHAVPAYVWWASESLSRFGLKAEIANLRGSVRARAQWVLEGDHGTIIHDPLLHAEIARLLDTADQT